MVETSTKTVSSLHETQEGASVVAERQDGEVDDARWGVVNVCLRRAKRLEQSLVYA